MEPWVLIGIAVTLLFGVVAVILKFGSGEEKGGKRRRHKKNKKTKGGESARVEEEVEKPDDQDIDNKDAQSDDGEDAKDTKDTKDVKDAKDAKDKPADDKESNQPRKRKRKKKRRNRNKVAAANASEYWKNVKSMTYHEYELEERRKGNKTNLTGQRLTAQRTKWEEVDPHKEELGMAEQQLEEVLDEQRTLKKIDQQQKKKSKQYQRELKKAREERQLMEQSFKKQSKALAAKILKAQKALGGEVAGDSLARKNYIANKGKQPVVSFTSPHIVEASLEAQRLKKEIREMNNSINKKNQFLQKTKIEKLSHQDIDVDQEAKLEKEQSLHIDKLKTDIKEAKAAKAAVAKELKGIDRKLKRMNKYNSEELLNERVETQSALIQKLTKELADFEKKVEEKQG